MVNQFNPEDTQATENALLKAINEYTSLKKSVYIERHSLSPRAPLPIAGKQTATSQNLCQKEKLILLVGNGEVTAYVEQYLSTMDNCVIFNALKANKPFDLSEMVESVNPDLIIASMKAYDPKGLQLIREIRSKSFTIPIIFFTEKEPGMRGGATVEVAEKASEMANSTEASEMQSKINAAIALSDIIEQYRQRQESAQAENQKLVESYKLLKSDVDSKQREYLSHLELLIYSKEVNESLLEKVLDLKPYLNSEGKSRLNFIIKKMKWEINDENQLNIERKLDQSHYTFHQLLSDKSPELTKYEKRLCTYFHTNHSSAETARITRRSPNCINVAFSRIRIKLGVKSNQELKVFLADLYSSVPQMHAQSQE